MLKAYSSHAFTGGQDCLVRIWKMDEGADQEPDMATEADQAITSVAATSDCWISASEDGEVRRYVKDRSDLDGLVTTTAGIAIRNIAFDPKGKRVAVASECVRSLYRGVALADVHAAS